MMQYLLSLPRGLVPCFHSLENREHGTWFVDSDPEGRALGSGGGTAHLLSRCWQEDGDGNSFQSWLTNRKRIVIHAGGKSRRLPAYAPASKILTPVPVFRWKKGQRINQKLLDIQIPFYEKILRMAPPGLNTLIASGDILILNDEDTGPLPDADIVVFGTWEEAHKSSRHGVFFCNRNKPGELAFIMQKPSPEKIQDLTSSYLFMMDAGVWLLSSRAVGRLMAACGWDNQTERFSNNDNIADYYDLYGEFSRFLGNEPMEVNALLNDLTTAVVPLRAGSFYHYGTSNELIDATFRIQNRVPDQRSVLQKGIKRHPDIFIMNSSYDGEFGNEHGNIWIENSHISSGWNFSNDHVFTGIPVNKWQLNIPRGTCIDIIPVDNEKWCIRPYGMEDTFIGVAGEGSASWLNRPLFEWLEGRGLSLEAAGIDAGIDIHDAPLFPVVSMDSGFGGLLQWMIDGTADKDRFSHAWTGSERLSASMIPSRTNLTRLYRQRDEFLASILPLLEKNHKKSIFYHLDLDDLSDLYDKHDVPAPGMLNEGASPMNRVHNRMFLANLSRKKDGVWQGFEQDSFRLLRESIIENTDLKYARPIKNVLDDQILWARSPVRLDLAGGWSDTPPYCIINGGRVVNMGVDLNGQPPIQVYITPTGSDCIRIKSIDLGQEALIAEYADLEEHGVGSGFAIARVALMLSGFHPSYGAPYSALKEQLKDFGGGFDISLLAAVPKGSGLGTSSILAATLLGVLAEFCGLKSDHVTLGNKTLVLEQMLTTGGGWQDQYGGILSGIKLIETTAGFKQVPEIQWLPDNIFQNQENRACMLLYYTGVTRVAKNILGEIVRRIFLNHSNTLDLINQISLNAGRIADALRKSSWDYFNESIEYSWDLNCRLDKGTSPGSIKKIIDPIEPMLASKKLLGAGGGGYLLMIAKDPDAAGKVKKHLSENVPNNKARFVEFSLSANGMTITKS